MGFLDLIYGVFVQPRRLFRSLAEQPRPGAAFLAVIIVAVLNLVTQVYVVLPGELNNVPQGAEELALVQEFFRLPSMQILMIIAGALFSLVWLVMQAGYFQVLAEMLGGIPRSALALFSALALAQTVQVVMIPLQALVAIGVLNQLLLGLGALIVYIYSSLILPYWAMREISELSSGRTLLVVFSPLLIFLAFLILIGAGIGIAVQHFGDFFNSL
ncbi:Yip1 domain-containing protein [Carboxydocella sporoproducens DSM 16521]|uniref:Yip1 domain-containing protein n=2 Tax=Carboxydocella TaxID=178898 RepID=A0A1T4PJL9_9FIRM|nr:MULTISPECIES: YIP1 family protein [Carboxydocella]AVX19513.1 Yip1 domain-containing protein [Carboxydocella thermautotrophica]AVX29931.1 Yip1 domain-containing protein [Carboxydocella thermautotrophica]SJZ91669.1 Yip1 domain-containing protein [Carboxydocella sporoproducens DSM 16521]